MSSSKERKKEPTVHGGWGGGQSQARMSQSLTLPRGLWVSEGTARRQPGLAAKSREPMSSAMEGSRKTGKTGQYSLKKDQPRVALKHLPLKNLLVGAPLARRQHDSKLHSLTPRAHPLPRLLPPHFPIMHVYFTTMKGGTHWIASCLPQIAAHLRLRPTHTGPVPSPGRSSPSGRPRAHSPERGQRRRETRVPGLRRVFVSQRAPLHKLS